MKRIISQLNRKLPELLKEKAKPAITLMDYQPQIRQATVSTKRFRRRRRWLCPKKRALETSNNTDERA
ncbi:MAG: hypothetical protein QXU11_00920 [Thermoproteota archaeon]